MRPTKPIKKSIQELLTENGFDWDSGQVFWTHARKKPLRAHLTELKKVCVLNPNHETSERDLFDPFRASDKGHEYRLAMYLPTAMSGLFTARKEDTELVHVKIDIASKTVSKALRNTSISIAKGTWNNQECHVAGWYDVNLYVVAATEDGALSGFVKVVNSHFMNEMMIQRYTDNLTFLMTWKKLVGGIR